MRARPGVDHAEPDFAREIDMLPSTPLVEHLPEGEFPHGHPLGRHGSCSHGRCLAAEPNDPRYATSADQWHLYAISAPSAWEISTGDPARGRICVIDTGGRGRCGTTVCDARCAGHPLAAGPVLRPPAQRAGQPRPACITHAAAAGPCRCRCARHPPGPRPQHQLERPVEQVRRLERAERRAGMGRQAALPGPPPTRPAFRLALCLCLRCQSGKAGTQITGLPVELRSPCLLRARSCPTPLQSVRQVGSGARPTGPRLPRCDGCAAQLPCCPAPAVDRAGGYRWQVRRCAPHHH